MSDPEDTPNLALVEPPTDAHGRRMVAVTLEAPLKRGETEIRTIHVRRPGGGDLRGVSLVALGQLEYDEIERLLPRVTLPPITALEIQIGLDPYDITRLGAAAADFLLNRG